jgi:hypothetical protein
MSGFDTQSREVCVIFKLPTLDKDLLALRFDLGKRVELIFKNFGRLGEV